MPGHFRSDLKLRRSGSGHFKRHPKWSPVPVNPVSCHFIPPGQEEGPWFHWRMEPQDLTKSFLSHVSCFLSNFDLESTHPTPLARFDPAQVRVVLPTRPNPAHADLREFLFQAITRACIHEIPVAHIVG